MDKYCWMCGVSNPWHESTCASLDNDDLMEPGAMDKVATMIANAPTLEETEFDNDPEPFI